MDGDASCPRVRMAGFAGDGRLSLQGMFHVRQFAHRWATSGAPIEIGKRVFGAQFVPMVVGAPSLRRYTVFGNLFAAVDGVVYRIDRHPTMKCHPVTPMREADLRLHLKAADRPAIGLLDMLQLESPDACEQFRDAGQEIRCGFDRRDE